MINECYWLKKLSILTLACCTLFIIRSLNSYGTYSRENYFNNQNSQGIISVPKVFFILPILDEDTEIKLSLSFNNFTTCRYSKVRGTALSSNDILTMKCNNILITNKYHSDKHNFVLFPLRC